MGSMRRLLLFLLVAFGVAALLLTAPVSADPAQTISFQGKLTNPDGTNVADGTYSITFTIYDGGTETGGGTAVWTETQSVGVSAGIFKVQLGSVNTTLGTTVNFNDSPLYLGIQVGSDPEMTPRVLFSSSPYAFNAGTLSGLTAANFVQLAQGPQTDSSATNASIAINKTGSSAPIINLQRGGSTVLGVNNDGSALFQNQGDSPAGFQIANSGSTPLFTANTQDDKVIVGSPTTDATQVSLQLDSLDSFADAATCGTTTNQGAMYYNTATGTMRSCINGNWEDMMSTDGLGLLAFGVSPTSSNAGNPGEISGINPSTSPCMVYYDSNSSVAVAPCRAYSGGRKVTVPATTISVSTMTKNRYANICLASDGTPELEDTTGATSDAASVKPAWSANAPILCLATVQASGTNGRLGKIYDIRTFTDTLKTFATSNKNLGLGWAIIQGNKNLVNTTTTAGAGNVRGIVVAYSGATSSTTANVILATDGPQWVKATGTSTAKQVVETSTTAGYTSTVASGTGATSYYALLGTATRTISTTCTSAANCQYSQFLNPLAIR